MPVRLYIGNLPKEIDRKELQEVFAEEGDLVTAKVITDRKTGKCRGFGFVTVPDEMADQIVEKYNGVELKETSLKIEKALPRKKNGKGEKGEGVLEEEPNTPPKSSSSPAAGNKNRKKSGKISSGGSGTEGAPSDSVQPDPRWASDLEKLKQMLSAQTTNS
ncbi:MAG: RNA recognition motif domain-containing protein [Microcoleaceae cyanobacterium]